MATEVEVLAVNRPTHVGSYRPRFIENHPRPAGRSSRGGFSDWWKDFWGVDDDDSDEDDREHTVVVKDALTIDLNKYQNRKEHRSIHYEASNLVLRRGQSFHIDIKLGGVQLDPTLDQLTLEFATGDDPKINEDTLCRIKVYKSKAAIPSDEAAQWQAYITSHTRTEVHIDVSAPPNAIVGRYTLTAKMYAITNNLDNKRYVSRCDDDIYVIFNAWCQDDQVYVREEDERQEYVLQDTGRMYVGDHTRMSSRPWRYGQFDEVCLEAACHLLDRSRLRKQGHGNVTQVCRALTSQLNSKDNSGVLVGNWTGSYPGGVSPVHWNGSVAIIEQYMRTKQPVKYGQCWVFSGIMTTVCRALGIPCRSITNFLSGIDRDMSMTIDWYVNEHLEPQHDRDDSRWNFHVWNEGWFKRPDLPDGYDGWQAMDSCPQDSMISDGLHCCGPAPLKAIKEGNIYLSHDAGFLFAEVNGDQITWLVKKNGETQPMKNQSQFNYIGKNISTKEVGRNSRNDITDLYKYPEGSAKEREAAERAGSFGSRKAKLLKFYDDDVVNDVKFTIEGKTHPNGDIEMFLRATNESKELRSVELKMTATAAYYTGSTGEQVAVTSHRTDLHDKDAKNIRWTLPASLYLESIDEDALLKIWVVAKIKQTGQMFFSAETFDTDKPDLIVELDKKKVRVGEVVEVTVRFENPLDLKLRNGVLQIEGLGSNKHIKIPLHRGINRGQSMVEKVNITPQFPGKTEIIASVNFRQLSGICGAAEIEIVE